MKHFARDRGAWLTFAGSACGQISTRLANDALARLTRNPNDVECGLCLRTREFSEAVKEPTA